MRWGIAETASEKEKIKSEFADLLHRLNSCEAIDVYIYDTLWNSTMSLFDKMYEQGKKDAKVKE